MAGTASSKEQKGVDPFALPPPSASSADLSVTEPRYVCSAQIREEDTEEIIETLRLLFLHAYRQQVEPATIKTLFFPAQVIKPPKPDEDKNAKSEPAAANTPAASASSAPAAQQAVVVAAGGGALSPSGVSGGKERNDFSTAVMTGVSEEKQAQAFLAMTATDYTINYGTREELASKAKRFFVINPISDPGIMRRFKSYLVGALYYTLDYKKKALFAFLNETMDNDRITHTFQPGVASLVVAIKRSISQLLKNTNGGGHFLISSFGLIFQEYVNRIYKYQELEGAATPDKIKEYAQMTLDLMNFLQQWEKYLTEDRRYRATGTTSFSNLIEKFRVSLRECYWLVYKQKSEIRLDKMIATVNTQVKGVFQPLLTGLFYSITGERILFENIQTLHDYDFENDSDNSHNGVLYRLDKQQEMVIHLFRMMLIYLCGYKPRPHESQNFAVDSEGFQRLIQRAIDKFKHRYVTLVAQVFNKIEVGVSSEKALTILPNEPSIVLNPLQNKRYNAIFSHISEMMGLLLEINQTLPSLLLMQNAIRGVGEAGFWLGYADACNISFTALRISIERLVDHFTGFQSLWTEFKRELVKIDLNDGSNSLSEKDKRELKYFLAWNVGYAANAHGVDAGDNSLLNRIRKIGSDLSNFQFLTQEANIRKILANNCKKMMEVDNVIFPMVAEQLLRLPPSEQAEYQKRNPVLYQQLIKGDTGRLGMSGFLTEATSLRLGGPEQRQGAVLALMPPAPQVEVLDDDDSKKSAEEDEGKGAALDVIQEELDDKEEPVLRDAKITQDIFDQFDNLVADEVSGYFDSRLISVIMDRMAEKLISKQRDGYRFFEVDFGAIRQDDNFKSKSFIFTSDESLFHIGTNSRLFACGLFAYLSDISAEIVASNNMSSEEMQRGIDFATKAKELLTQRQQWIQERFWRRWFYAKANTVLTTAIEKLDSVILPPLKIKKSSTEREETTQQATAAARSTKKPTQEQKAKAAVNSRLTSASDSKETPVDQTFLSYVSNVRQFVFKVVYGESFIEILPKFRETKEAIRYLQGLQDCLKRSGREGKAQFFTESLDELTILSTERKAALVKQEKSIRAFGRAFERKIQDDKLTRLTELMPLHGFSAEQTALGEHLRTLALHCKVKIRNEENYRWLLNEICEKNKPAMQDGAEEEIKATPEQPRQPAAVPPSQPAPPPETTAAVAAAPEVVAAPAAPLPSLASVPGTMFAFSPRAAALPLSPTAGVKLSQTTVIRIKAVSQLFGKIQQLLGLFVSAENLSDVSLALKQVALLKAIFGSKNEGEFRANLKTAMGIETISTEQLRSIRMVSSETLDSVYVIYRSEKRAIENLMRQLDANVITRGKGKPFSEALLLVLAGVEQALSAAPTPVVSPMAADPAAAAPAPM